MDSLNVVDPNEPVEVRDEAEGQVVEVARVDGDVHGAADLGDAGSGVVWKREFPK